VIKTGTSQNPVGKKVCENQPIVVSSPLTVVCLVTQQVIWVTDPKDLARCSKAPQKLRSCNPQSRVYCSRVRTGEIANKPNLVKPYGVVLRSQPVQFSWIGVKGADHYRVVTEGVSIPRTVQFTSDRQIQLKLPTGTIALVVQGMRGNEVIGSSVTTFDVIGIEGSSQLAQQLKLIDGFSGSPEENVLLKLSLFSSKGLVNDAILFLEQHQNLRHSAILLRTLADLYLDVGQLDAAKKNYENAMVLAKQQNNYAEYSKARDGYHAVSSLLLPGTNQQRS
jgi:hypothetical protein